MADDSGSTLQTIMAILVGLLMLGLGSTVSVRSFMRNLRTAKGPIVGLLCQLLAMPFLAYILSVIFQFPAITTISVIAIGCTPGGSTSNLFSYFSRGDVSLSITMTVVSSLMSFGTLPLLLWMLAEPFSTESVRIPYTNILLALILVVIPVAIGVTIRSRCISVAYYLEKAATALGAIFIIVAIVYGSITEADIFLAPPSEWVTCFLMCLGGSGLGYLLAILSGLHRYQARTVALETGIQNSTLTVAIMTFTFGGTPQLGAALRFPLLYSLVIIICGVIMSSIFFVAARYDPQDQVEARQKHEDEEAAAVATEQAELAAKAGIKDGPPERLTSSGDQALKSASAAV